MTQEFNKRIAVAYGDGIGPEIMESTIQIIQAAEVNLSIDVITIGAEQYRRNYSAGIPPSAWETIRNSRIILKAPITTPQGKGYKSLNVTLRKTLGLYANLRPVKSYYPFVKCNFPKMNLVIVRENEEDLYAGIEYRLSKDFFESLKLMSRSGSDKLVKFAYDYALKNKHNKITCFMKDNIMKITDGMFHQSFNEIGEFYPELEKNQMIVDIATAKVAADPEQFEVIVTGNLYGDIVSDVAAEVSGSVGLCGSANIGADYAMFEAIHGSAPDIAGQDIANPTGLINASTMMLRHIGEYEKASLIENAVNYTIEQGVHTGDLYDEETSSKKVGTKDFTKAVIANLGKTPKTLFASKTKYDAEKVEDRVINLKEKFPEAAERSLVGVDIFIDTTPGEDINNLAKRIKSASDGLVLNLQMLSSKGLKIWPSDSGTTRPISDCIRTRFVSKKEDKSASNEDIVELLATLQQNEISFVKTENLYLYDGVVSFSAPQGE